MPPPPLHRGNLTGAAPPLQCATPPSAAAQPSSPATTSHRRRLPLLQRRLAHHPLRKSRRASPLRRPSSVAAAPSRPEPLRQPQASSRAALGSLARRRAVAGPSRCRRLLPAKPRHRLPEPKPPYPSPSLPNSLPLTSVGSDLRTRMNKHRPYRYFYRDHESRYIIRKIIKTRRCVRGQPYQRQVSLRSYFHRFCQNC